MDKTAATKILMKDPKTLTPYAKNAKVHRQKDIDRLAGQIAAFGFDQPILVDQQSVIIKGHKRREAAMQLNLDKVPVIVSDRDEYENMANRLADNAVVGKEYDDNMLRFDLGTLATHDFNMDLTGLEADTIDMLLADVDVGPMPTEGQGTEASSEQGDADDTHQGSADKALYMTFGDEKLVVSEEEVTIITDKLREYELRTGTRFNFIADLCGA